LMPTRPSRNLTSRRNRREMHRRRVTSVPERASQGTTRRPLPDQPPPTSARARKGSGAGCGAARSQIVASIQPPCTPTVTLTGWRLPDPYRMAVVTASLTASTRSSTTSPEMSVAAAASWFGRHAAARQGRPARRRSGRPAIARCRRCGRHGLVGGPGGPGSTAPSPCGGGDGVEPAQPRPAAKPASWHRRGLLRLGRRRPSSSPWPATAGPAPPPAARCRAPGTAVRRGCRTAARGRGTPGSASRRSAGCTDGGRRASASRCICGPCRSPIRAGW
jgi:hypothetical protein